MEDNMMDNDTVSLLKECNAGCKSATNSMEQVLEHVKNDKLCALIDKYNGKHIGIGDECHKLLNELGENEKDPKKMAAVFAEVGTEVKLMMEDSTHKAAELLVDGCNMGIKSLSEYMNKYTTADENVVKLVKELIKVEQDFMKDLLEFL